jgi:hypothetical protein
MPRYSTAQIDAALHEARGMLWIAAKRLGCSPNTIKARVAQTAALRETLELERGLAGDTAELKLYQAVQNGEAWAIQFYLRTVGKDRGYVTRDELTGKDGAPLGDSLTDEERARRILAILQRARERATGLADLAEADLGPLAGPAE